MSIKERLQDDMKTAMRAKEKARLTAIRMILAGIKQVEIDKQITLDDAEAVKLLSKMVKQRRDAITQYNAANRPELAEKENAELALIETYLPKAASDDEINAELETAIQTTGATSMQDMGKVMGILKTQLAGRADMAKLSQMVKSKLS